MIDDMRHTLTTCYTHSYMPSAPSHNTSSHNTSSHHILITTSSLHSPHTTSSHNTSSKKRPIKRQVGPLLGVTPAELRELDDDDNSVDDDDSDSDGDDDEDGEWEWDDSGSPEGSSTGVLGHPGSSPGPSPGASGLRPRGVRRVGSLRRFGRAPTWPGKGTYTHIVVIHCHTQQYFFYLHLNSTQPTLTHPP